MNKKQSLSGRLLWKCIKKLVLELILSRCSSPLASSPKFTDLLQLYSSTRRCFLFFFFYLSYYLNSFFYYSVLLKRVITFTAFTFPQTILFLQNLSPDTPPPLFLLTWIFFFKFFTCFVKYSPSAHLLMLALLSSAYLFSECGRRVLHSDQFFSQYTPHLEAVSFAPRNVIVIYTLRSSASLSASRCHFSTLEMYFCFFTFKFHNQLKLEMF